LIFIKRTSRNPSRVPSPLPSLLVEQNLSRSPRPASRQKKISRGRHHFTIQNSTDCFSNSYSEEARLFFASAGAAAHSKAGKRGLSSSSKGRANVLRNRANNSRPSAHKQSTDKPFVSHFVLSTTTTRTAATLASSILEPK